MTDPHPVIDSLVRSVVPVALDRVGDTERAATLRALDRIVDRAGVAAASWTLWSSTSSAAVMAWVAGWATIVDDDLTIEAAAIAQGFADRLGVKS